MRLAPILILATIFAPSTVWAQSDTTVLFIGNSFTYGHGSAARYYRSDTVTDLNHTTLAHEDELTPAPFVLDDPPSPGRCVDGR